MKCQNGFTIFCHLWQYPPECDGIPIGKIRIGIFSIEMRNAMFGIWVVFSWIFVQIQNENIIDFALLLVNDNVFYFFFFSVIETFIHLSKNITAKINHTKCVAAHLNALKIIMR